MTGSTKKSSFQLTDQVTMLKNKMQLFFQSNYIFTQILIKIFMITKHNAKFMWNHVEDWICPSSLVNLMKKKFSNQLSLGIQEVINVPYVAYILYTVRPIHDMNSPLLTLPDF